MNAKQVKSQNHAPRFVYEILHAFYGEGQT